MLEQLSAESKAFDLEINILKTKIMFNKHINEPVLITQQGCSTINRKKEEEHIDENDQNITVHVFQL